MRAFDLPICERVARQSPLATRCRRSKRVLRMKQNAPSVENCLVCRQLLQFAIVVWRVRVCLHRDCGEMREREKRAFRIQLVGARSFAASKCRRRLTI